MPTTPLPDHKEKAHEIARQIANERPPRRKDKDAPDANVTGGFNQKRDEPKQDEDAASPPAEENSVTVGDGQ